MLLKKAEKRFKLATKDYAQLASFRHALRGFLRFSEAAAEREGLTSQHYQAMLILRGWPDGEPISSNDLAQQLLIRHNSAVGLVDRLANEGLVVREASAVDRRKVELHLSSRGRQVLAQSDRDEDKQTDRDDRPSAPCNQTRHRPFPFSDHPGPEASAMPL